MERYIGMDVHAASCTLAVISQTGEAVEGLPGRDQRPGPGRGRAHDSGPEVSDLRRGTSERVAVRDAEPSRGRDRRCRDQGEPRAEERQARCVWLGREAAHGEPRQAGLQGSPSVHAPARALASPHHAGRRRRAGAGSDQESVPIPRCHGDRPGCLQPSSPRRVAEAALLQRANESDKTLRSSRLLGGAEEAGGGRSASRGEEASHRPNPGDRTRPRTDPRSTAGPDCRDAPPLPHEATVLELLRARHRDPLELGTGSRRPMEAGSRRGLLRREGSPASTIAS